MAVGKEALAPSICVTSAACRAALDATVAKFNEVFEAMPPATARRRLKDADIDLDAIRPVVANGFSVESPRAVKSLECPAVESSE